MLSYLGARLVHLGAMLGHLKAMSNHLGAMLSHLQAHFGPTRPLTGRSWESPGGVDQNAFYELLGVLEASWGQDGS